MLSVFLPMLLKYTQTTKTTYNKIKIHNNLYDFFLKRVDPNL